MQWLRCGSHLKRGGVTGEKNNTEKSKIHGRVICPTSDGEEVLSPATQMSLSVGYRHHIVTVVVSCEILLDCYFFFLVLRLKKLSSNVSV